MGYLSERQIRFFRDMGYIKINEVISNENIDILRELIDHDIRNKKPPYRTKNNQIIRLDDLIDRNPIIYEILKLPSIINPLESLLGPNIEMTKNRHNHATLNLKDSNDVRLHRDVLQWTRSVITVVVYLQPTTIDNGCTMVIPGSHYLPFVGTPNNGGTWMDEHHIYSELINQALPIPMPRGGILLFDSLVFHSVGQNITNDSRISITMAFHSVDELSGIDDPNKVLILGQRIYKGNDI